MNRDVLQLSPDRKAEVQETNQRFLQRGWKISPRIEQVRKRGLPPLLLGLDGRGQAPLPDLFISPAAVSSQLTQRFRVNKRYEITIGKDRHHPVLHARRIRETHDVPHQPFRSAAAESIDDVQYSQWPCRTHKITIKHKMKNTKKHKTHSSNSCFFCAFLWLIKNVSQHFD